jgi:prepilin-type N-terminal cleavage/methylation domain-containing protein
MTSPIYSLPLVREDRPTRRGMTLVEVLIVVVIIGLAAAIGVPMLMQPGAMKIQAASRMIMADILVAQNEAVGHVSPRRVHFNVAGNSYRLTDGQDVTIGTTWQKQPYEVSFATDSRFSGVTLDSVSFGGNAWIGFDELGGAVNGGTIELSAQGFGYRINVRPLTGRVDVEQIN